MAIKRLILKLLIDKEKNKVVFLESDKDFVDILFSLLALPIGNIIRLLSKKSGIKGLDKLYASVEDLDAKHLQTEACKEMLLHPRRASEQRFANLVLDVDDTNPRVLYRCHSWSCCIQNSRAFTFMENVRCPCGLAMDAPLDCPLSEDKENGMFAMGRVMFLVTDDLHVSVISMATLVVLLDSLGIQDKSALEERTVEFGKEELLNLLSRTLVSKTPLTDVFLRKLTVTDAAKEVELKGGVEQEVGNAMCFGFPNAKVNLPGSKVTLASKAPLPDMFLLKLNVTGSAKELELKGGNEQKVGNDMCIGLLKDKAKLPGSKGMNAIVSARADKDFTHFPFRCFTLLLDSMKRSVSGSPLGSKLNMKSKKVKLKLIVSRVKNKVVCAEAGKDFVDLLFSFLTIPLGSIVKLLDENSSLGCIDNLYRSVKELTNAKHFVKSKECKDKLLSPKIATHFGCSNQLLRFEESDMVAGIYGCDTCSEQELVPAGKPDAKCKHGINVVLLREMNLKLANPGTESGGGFVKEPGKFLVNDKMEVKMQSPLSTLHVLNEFEGFLDDFEERDIEIGKIEVLKLLKACLNSRAPLSVIFPCFSERNMWP